MKTLSKVIVVAVALLLAGCSGRKMMDEPMDKSMEKPMTGMENPMEKPMSSIDSMSGSMSGEMMKPQTESMGTTMQ